VRRLFKTAIYFVLGLLSVESFVWVADWSGRAQWVHDVLIAHPHIDAIVRGPAFPLICLILCVAVVKSQEYFSSPDIRVKCLRAYLQAKVGQVSGNSFDGLLKHIKDVPPKIDYDLVLSLEMVNRSESATLKPFDGYVVVDGTRIPLKPCPDFKNYSIRVDRRNYRPNGSHETESQYTPLSNLWEKIGSSPLERGVEFKGWIGFRVEDLDRRNAHRIKLKLWAVDAFGGRHSVNIKHGVLNKATQDGALTYY
jgi:hypothetical protein